MIVRIVKLSFQEDKVHLFLENFHKIKNKIRAFKGCNRLELLKVKDNNNIFMTYSFWDDEDDLNNYRKSDLFRDVWGSTKVLFNDKPEAWTVTQEDILE